MIAPSEIHRGGRAHLFVSRAEQSLRVSTGDMDTEYAYLVFMSIRHGLLALLHREPKYGYQLRSEFESATGATWPLNVGQVYTTLTRLERDGLVEPQGQDAEGRIRFAISDSGRTELAGWFGSPVTSVDRPRDELAIKLALAVTIPGVDLRAIVQRQRNATITQLQELTRLKRDGEQDLSWSLVVESMRYHAEAEVRWLDHCEAALARAQRTAEARASTSADAAQDSTDPETPSKQETSR
jgi:DNA-binding PadR family transcriptional regulator